MSILSNLLALGFPSLQAGDDLNNSILEIDKLLKQIELFPAFKAIDDKPAPRVLTINTNPPLRVLEQKNNPNIIEFNKNRIYVSLPIGDITGKLMSQLQTSSSLLKNSRFYNTNQHHCNL